MSKYAGGLVWVFAWRMFHEHSVIAETRQEAERQIHAERPTYIPEGTELRFVRNYYRRAGT